MKLFLVNVCFLVVLMVVIGTSSGAVTNSTATKGINARSCQVDDDCADENLCLIYGCDQGICYYIETDCPYLGKCIDSYCDQTTGDCVGEPVSCPLDTLCTTYYCNPAVGCYPVDKDCDDGNACTNDIRCDPANGECFHEDVFCGIDTDCTTYSCNEATGLCETKITACDDGVPCTVDTCSATGCVYTPIDARCDDSNPCTDDVCTSTGCKYPPKPCSVDCPCPANQECKCQGGTCTCVNKVVPPTVPACCQTEINFDIKTCGSTTPACSGTP